MKTTLQTINKHRGAIITIAIVAVCTIIGVNAALGVIYKTHLLQSPCDLCESFQEAKRIPLDIEQLNRELNITKDLGMCQGAMQLDINKSHFRETCESIPI